MYRFCILKWAGYSTLERVSVNGCRRATSKNMWVQGYIYKDYVASRGELCAFFILHILLQIPVHFQCFTLLMQTSGIDHLLFSSMKSSIPGADLISFRKGIVTMDVYVRFSWYISVWKTAGEELGSINELRPTLQYCWPLWACFDLKPG